MPTSYQTKKVYKVTISGSVVIEADNGPDAQAKATAYWIAGGAGLDFSVTEQTQIKPVTTP